MRLINISSLRKFLFNKRTKYLSLDSRYLSISQDSRILKSSSSDVLVPSSSVTDLIFSKIEKYSKFTAIECSITGKKYSYEHLNLLSTNFGKALRWKLNLEQDDVVAIALENCPEFAIATLGIISGGLVLTTVNPIYTADEIGKQFQDCKVKAIVTKSQYYRNIEMALIIAKLEAPIITVKEELGESIPRGAVHFEEFINEQSNTPTVSRKPSDLAFLPYSSGTTGLPKGVQLTHQNLAVNLCQFTHRDFNHAVPPSDSHQDTVPLILPMFHIYGFMVGILKQLWEGAKILTVPRFNPEKFISLLKENKVNHLYLAPPLALFMIANPNVKSEYLKHLRMLTCGGAPLSYADELRLSEKCNNDDLALGQIYGLTEASPGVTFVPTYHKLSNKNGGSVGKVLPNTSIKIKAVDVEDDLPERLLGPNEEGELLIKGPQTTPGYFKRPEENKNLYINDWLKSGDIAYYNEDGYVFVTDRLKELIKVKGFQVPPAELEAVLRSYPGVEDAAVIGVAHPTQGEVPRAFVVPKKGQSLQPEKIQEYVSKKVIKYKHLTGGVEVIDVIPRTASGKILRRELKKYYNKNK